LSITKEGSRLLRWALIETAWRLVAKTARWRRLYERLRASTGHKKKAIVGGGRRLLGVRFWMVRGGQGYPPTAEGKTESSKVLRIIPRAQKGLGRTNRDANFERPSACPMSRDGSHRSTLG